MPVTNEQLSRIASNQMAGNVHEAVTLVAQAVLDDRKAAANRRTGYSRKGNKKSAGTTAPVVRGPGLPVLSPRRSMCGKCGAAVARFNRRSDGAIYYTDIEMGEHEGVQKEFTGHNWFHKCKSYREAGR